MEKKTNKLLQVVSIIWLVFASIGLIIALIAIAGTFLLFAAGLALLAIAALVGVVGMVIAFVASIVGIKNASKPEKAGTCIGFGITVIALSLLSTVLGLAAGGTFDWISLFVGLVIPALYLIGAFQNKKLAG